MQKKFKKYKLGTEFDKLYFTQREAQCMVLLLKGKSIITTAHELLLSPRTVEFYLNNMKAKLQCRTKLELIDRVSGSEFLQNYANKKDHPWSQV